MHCLSRVPDGHPIAPRLRVRARQSRVDLAELGVEARDLVCCRYLRAVATLHGRTVCRNSAAHVSHPLSRPPEEEPYHSISGRLSREVAQDHLSGTELPRVV